MYFSSPDLLRPSYALTSICWFLWSVIFSIYSVSFHVSWSAFQVGQIADYLSLYISEGKERNKHGVLIATDQSNPIQLISINIQITINVFNTWRINHTFWDEKEKIYGIIVSKWLVGEEELSRTFQAKLFWKIKQTALYKKPKRMKQRIFKRF